MCTRDSRQEDSAAHTFSNHTTGSIPTAIPHLLTPTLQSAAMNVDPLFSRTRRIQAIWEEVHDVDPFLYVEEMLVVPVEVFLDIHWSWDDLWIFISANVRRKFLWLTDDTFIAVGDVSHIFDRDTPYDILLIASSTTTSGQVQTLTLIQEMDANVSAEAFLIFWKAIETNNNAKIKIQGDENCPSSQLLPGPLLSQLLQGRPLRQGLDFCEFNFMEEHCRALATLERADLKVTLCKCALVPQNAQDMFVEWFRHNQVVTELNNCSMETRFISALSENNCLRKLSLVGSVRFGWERLIALTQALLTNQGIEDLDINFHMTLEECKLLFRSLSTHPQIKFLSLWNNFFWNYTHAAKLTIMHEILQMLRLNTVVQAIELPGIFNDEAMYQNFILPKLEINRSCFEVQRQAVKRADPSIRPQLLGRALHVVRYNPELVFRFLSENVPAFIRTEEDEEVNEDREEDPNIPLEKDPNADSISGQKRKDSS
jgi:hypothetical protein